MGNGTEYAITGVFGNDYTTQLSEYVTLLFALAKMGGSKAQDRVRKTEELTESYFEHAGRHADSTQLGRMASLILYDDLTDGDRMKVRNTEYPFLSEDQQRRRDDGEVSEIWAESIAQDGRDHAPKTRDYARKLQLIGG